MNPLYILIIAFAALGCSSKNTSKPQRLQQVTYYAGSLGDKPWSIHSSIYAKGVFYRNVFTQGVYLNENSQVVPGLFSSWVKDKKNKSYTVNLDRSYHYERGKPVNATDVEFLYLKVFLTPENYPPFPFQKNFKGAEKLKKGDNFRSGMCECIKIRGHKITFYLKKFDPYFLHKLAHYFYPIAPIDKFGPDLFSFKGLPLGSGAYKVISYDDHKNLTILKLKDEYALKESYSGAPETINFYNSGEFDEIHPDLSYNLSDPKRNRKYKRILGKVPDAIQIINFNFENDLGKNLKFRKAISLAINREEITSGEIDRSPAFRLILNDGFKINENQRFFDKAEARKIVKRYFEKISSRNNKLKALYYGSSRSRKPRLYTIIEKQLSDIGIHIDFQPSNFSELKRGENKNIVMTSIGKILPFHDFVYPFFIYAGSDESFLNTDLDKKKLTTLYHQALETESLIKKKAIIGRLANLHAKYFIQIPLYKTYPVVYAKGTITKVDLNNPLGLIEFGKIR